MGFTVSQRVLILNRLWQAVNIVGAKRAFGLLLQDNAKVIHSTDDDFQVLKSDEWIAYSMSNPPMNDEDCVHTVRYKIRIPSILLLNYYDKLPMKEVKFTRQHLFERDKYTCQYCGGRFSQRELNLDHVIPRDRGGKTSWENIVTSCLHCNTRKGNRFPHEAGLRLKHKPIRPKWRPFISFFLGPEYNESWKHFLKAQRS